MARCLNLSLSLFPTENRKGSSSFQFGQKDHPHVHISKFLYISFFPIYCLFWYLQTFCCIRLFCHRLGYVISLGPKNNHDRYYYTITASIHFDISELIQICKFLSFCTSCSLLFQRQNGLLHSFSRAMIIRITVGFVCATLQ